MVDVLLDKSKHNYEIAQIAQSKKFYEVAISRYYYALFQEISFILRSKYDKFIEPVGKDSHKEIVKQLYNYIYTNCSHLRDEDVASIGCIIELKKMRVTADYKLEIMDENKFQNVFMKRYNPCFKVIESLI